LDNKVFDIINARCNHEVYIIVMLTSLHVFVGNES